ncbi:hypothetical protein QUF81_07235 [Peribacillus simplex]|uniref:sunset domain-containing protein n=1 Tax=Peribacillus simplex TaxID=1478 RepID=UPI0025A27BEE|nr:hypothetical protein [Peribacillus simplex]MDM5292990.1 hypothetical protein [Peribacillus simplex]
MTEEQEDKKKVAIPIEGEKKKKKKWYWGCGGCGCLGFILIVLIGGCVALFGTDEDDSDKKVDNKVINVKEEEKNKAKKEQEEKEKSELAKKEQEEKDKAEQAKKEQEEKEKAQQAEQDKKEADQAKTEKACLNIKGNTSSSGEKIYHVPGGQFYDKTNPEQTFCTEGEAKSAGYRESKR